MTRSGARVPRALAGVAIASFLTIVRYQGGVPLCATSGCEILQRSRYAELLGYVQLVVLDAVCIWCVACDVASAVVAIAAWLRLRHALT